MLSSKMPVHCRGTQASFVLPQKLTPRIRWVLKPVLLKPRMPKLVPLLEKEFHNIGNMKSCLNSSRSRAGKIARLRTSNGSSRIGVFPPRLRLLTKKPSIANCADTSKPSLFSFAPTRPSQPTNSRFVRNTWPQFGKREQKALRNQSKPNKKGAK